MAERVQRGAHGAERRRLGPHPGGGRYPSGRYWRPRATAVTCAMATPDDDADDLYYSIEIDWYCCPLLESVSDKVSGA